VDQDAYLDMVLAYAEYFRLPHGLELLKHMALEWAMQRGSRSGRTAWQFVQSLPA
jgi:predicted AAA+ superfamily ATPase